MIIIIKSPPYLREEIMGALFIGLSSSEANEPTSIIFAEEGLNCLFKDQNLNSELSMPSISDLIMQLIGLVKFYAITPTSKKNEVLETFIQNSSYIVPGVKLISYSTLIDLINEQGKNLFCV